MVASCGPPKTRSILAVLPKPAQRHLALHVGGLLERRHERKVARLLGRQLLSSEGGHAELRGLTKYGRV